jgi:hypothetical protein
MNLNIIGYGIYLTLTTIIIYRVGNICHNNGNIFIKNLLKKDIELSIQINKILLIGYYLLNIGYSAITIIQWNQINTELILIETISKKISIIILTISILHYSNIYLIKKFIHKLT